MADSLTRASTAKGEVWVAVTGATQFDPPDPLWDWLQNLPTDWDLGFKLIDWLKTSMKYISESRIIFLKKLNTTHLP